MAHRAPAGGTAKLKTAPGVISVVRMRRRRTGAVHNCISQEPKASCHVFEWPFDAVEKVIEQLYKSIMHKTRHELRDEQLVFFVGSWKGAMGSRENAATACGLAAEALKFR